ncbi:MAG: GspE/PulE family protein [Verrucomicrobia bacterium]|nr:GspE/PulE family protein [Verrucomicrobiota bacterium]
MQAQTVVDMLKNRNLVNNSQAEDIMHDAQTAGKSIQEIVVEYGLFRGQDEFWGAVADEIGAEYFDLSVFEPAPGLLLQVPAGMARLYGAFPVQITPEGLHVALMDPLNPQAVEDLRFGLGMNIIPVVAREEQVQALLDQHYGTGIESIEDILTQLGVSGSSGVGDAKGLEAEANSAPIVRFVDIVLRQAIKEKASDIHFEPFEHEFKIRYRVDGSLYEMAPPPVHLSNSVISRVKVMANMNIAERRLPQDGRIMTVVDNRPVDMRVSSLPTQYGESVVLRVLDRSSINLSLNGLGLPKYLFDYIQDTIHKPNGIFIVTGPTGAGKTTTLYAALKEINTIDAKLLTAEDPVEYEIDGIMQVPVNEAVGLTFARALRAFLRQDPDRIMVGEMRDKETAQIAIQASLTGHLVLSTLHTNDSAGAVTRLIDMGVEPFLVAATLEGVLAQRLLRTICKECRTPYDPSPVVLSQLGLMPSDIGKKKFYTGSGCASCANSGYKGRRGIYELLDITDPIREHITQKAPTLVVRQKAIELGMITLREDGLRNIYEGDTTIEEVLKYT